MEPSTIPLLYADAHRTFANPENRTVVADGILELERKQSLFQKIMWKRPVYLNESGISTLYGSIHAWNTQFIHDIGGLKKMLIEDFALGLDSYMRGYQTFRSSAKAWGYKPNSILDVARERVRFYRGYMQLNEMWRDYPKALEAIADYNPINHPLFTRLQIYADLLWKHRTDPKLLLKHTLSIGFQECCNIVAKYRHAQNPHAETWVQIQSSK